MEKVVLKGSVLHVQGFTNTVIKSPCSYSVLAFPQKGVSEEGTAEIKLNYVLNYVTLLFDHKHTCVCSRHFFE